MRTTRWQVAPGLMLCAGLALGVASQASAQNRFYEFFGGSVNDAARGGVIATSDGGFISVGESQSFGVGDYDVYVVKTDQCGNFQWSTTYDFGGDDYGRKIRETAKGNYIIVGSTDNLNSCCKHKGADILVLEIDSKGNFVWANTYGSINNDDQGTDIQLYNGGSEYIVSGRTNGFGAGDYDGYLMNIDAGGSVIWGRVFGGPLFDGFNSVAISASSDILAAGETYSYSPAADDQAWVVRANAKGNVIWSYNYGPFKTNEAANGIVEISDDEVAFVGYTDAINANGTRSPWLQKLDSKGNCLCNNAFFYKDESYGEFKEVKAIRNGDIVIAGFMYNPLNSLGKTDQLLVRVDPKCNWIWAQLYGGEAEDELYSVDLITTPDQDEPTGFVIAGWSRSGGFGLEDLTISRTDNGGFTCGCNTETKLEQKPLQFECPLKSPTCEPLVFNWCATSTKPVYNENWKFCCQEKCDQKRQQELPGNDGREHLGVNPNGVNGNVLRATATTPVVREHVVNNR